MTTIHISLEIDNSGLLVIERGDLATMVSIPANGDLAHEINKAVVRALTDIEAIVAAPPPDVKLPEPVKPAGTNPANGSKTTKAKPAPVKTSTPVAPAPPPSPRIQRWWTNEDDGKVVRDDDAESKRGHTGPYSSQSEAEANIPDWLKPAFNKKSKR